ncbi:hypothetical protein IEQ34_016825 [Dendrobium chrysotoxum]|uniref:Uncharacterized protein n=1 Tax=Dendrobium chrysotoxum TaxID=161865 RepID=A0AAV7GEQ1_DENCH|nr:hypothetical protein IEQ34_016825 [Dendrobium chrysotoxum]
MGGSRFISQFYLLGGCLVSDLKLDYARFCQTIFERPVSPDSGQNNFSLKAADFFTPRAPSNAELVGLGRLQQA